MINKIISNINFKRNISIYEQKGFSDSIESNKPAEQSDVVTNAIEKNVNDNYKKGRLFDKFASIYEKSDKPQIANLLYQKAVGLKDDSQTPIFELFKSYIALQKTYQDLNDTQSADKIENILKTKVKEAGSIKKVNLTKDDANEETISFIKTALIICKKLLDNNQIQISTAIFNEIEENVSKENIDITSFGNLYKEIEAEISEKNNLFDKSVSLYENLANSNGENDYQYKIIENKISKGDTKNIETMLNETFSKSETPDDILKNLFYRASYQLKNNNNHLAVKYLNIASTISDITNSDIKPEMNILIALLLRQNDSIEKSSEVCINNLTLLQKENKIFTQQFTKTMALLASNNYAEYLENPDLNSTKLKFAKNTYQNAYKIAKTINDNYSKNLIGTDMAQLSFTENDIEKAEKFAETTLKNCDDDSFRAKAYSVLGKISLKNNSNHLAIENFENERKCLVRNNSPLPIIKENAQNLIDVYQKIGNLDKVEEYTQILLDKGSARYQDLMELGNENFKLGNFNESQKYFEKAAELDNEDESAKAVATIHKGIAKLQTLNDKKALIDIEQGCKTLEKFVKSDNFKNPKETKNLIDTLSFVGDFYYFKKAKYEEAANIFVKTCEIQKQQKSVQLSKDFIKTTTLKAGASLYKAGKYEEALPYYIEILRNTTEIKDLGINSLNNKFVDNIVDTKDRKDCAKIATALEILGVINTKAERFIAAKNCFETAKRIREDAGGNNLLLANDYKALSRLDMLNNFESSKPKLEKAIELMKSSLGEKSDAVVKEQKFLDKYFGFSLTSGGKHAIRLFGQLKDLAGFDNNFKKEILNDFHIIYEDLALCE